MNALTRERNRDPENPRICTTAESIPRIDIGERVRIERTWVHPHKQSLGTTPSKGHTVRKKKKNRGRKPKVTNQRTSEKHDEVTRMKRSSGNVVMPRMSLISTMDK